MIGTAANGARTSVAMVNVATRRLGPPVMALPSPDHMAQMAATASLVPVGEGLYALDIGEIGCVPGRLSGLRLPMVQVSAPAVGQDQCVEIIGSGNPERWLGPKGGTIILKSPPGGGIVLLTAYGPPAESAAVSGP